MEGDEKYQCKTMPIVWGIPASKVFIGVWIVVLIGALLILQFYVFQLGNWLSALYCILIIIVPLIWILKKLSEAKITINYHQLSNLIKMIMLSGILSLLIAGWVIVDRSRSLFSGILSSNEHLLFVFGFLQFYPITKRAQLRASVKFLPTSARRSSGKD